VPLIVAHIVAKLIALVKPSHAGIRARELSILPETTDKGSTSRSWRHLSACLDEDGLFFSITAAPARQSSRSGGQSRSADALRRARAVPGLGIGSQDHGVWGGLGEDERRLSVTTPARASARSPDPRRTSIRGPASVHRLPTRSGRQDVVETGPTLRSPAFSDVDRDSDSIKVLIGNPG
jgi:hypothetical protein